MFHRVAVWAQDFEIVRHIVLPVSIAMVNIKAFWRFIPPAALTFDQHVPSRHRLSNGGVNRMPFSLSRLVDARQTAIDALVRCRSSKQIATVTAGVFGLTSTCQRSIVTRARTVFRLIATRTDVLEDVPTNRTIRGVLNTSGQSEASSRTISRGCSSVGTYRKCAKAMLTGPVNWHGVCDAS